MLTAALNCTCWRQNRLIEEVGYIGVGLFFGIISGLFPGLHLNTVSALMLALGIPGRLSVVLLIVAMNVMHAFVDFIPSILLGAPNPQTSLATLPGHRLLLAGKGMRGIELAIWGSLIGTIGAIGLIPVYWLLALQTQLFLIHTIPWTLLLLLVLLVWHEKNWTKRISAIATIGLSAGIGLVGLNQSGDLLFVLVTGFFGTSTVLFSLLHSSTWKKQEQPMVIRPAKKWFLVSFLGSACGALVSLFPALSPAHAAFIARGLYVRFSTQTFLVLQGAINASATVFSFVALQALGKARTGSAVAVQELYVLSQTEFIEVLCIILFSAGIAVFVSRGLSRIAIEQIKKVPYGFLSIGILLFLFLLAIVLNGTTGLFWMVLATLVGLIPHATGTQKTHLMAFLVAPTIAFYLQI